MNCIILAGGYGTRLRDVWDGPKCLVPVAGEPILLRILEKLMFLEPPPSKIVLVLGYKADKVLEWLWNYSKRRTYNLFDRVSVIVEKELRGTATALRQALPTVTEPLMVMNADTLPKYELESLLKAYVRVTSEPTKRILPAVAAWYQGNYAGACVLSKEATQFIDSGRATDLDFYLASTHHYEISGGYLDVGTPDNFYRAQSSNVLSIKEPT